MKRSLWPSVLILALALPVLAVMCRMALESRINAHPDEIYHIGAADYFVTYWDFPRVGDERTVKSFSNYGISYLNQLDIVYFLAGKFARAVSPLIPDTALGLRFFNITLYALLAAMALFVADDRKIAFLPLCLSPQVWYVFSYFNGDALPLFLCFVLVFVICRLDPDPDGAPGAVRPGPGWYAAMGLASGLILISKQNYYVFLAFLFAFLALAGPDRRTFAPAVARTLVVVALAGAIFAARYGYDLYVNRTVAEHEVTHYVEKYAKEEYKPSSQEQGKLFWGLRMRDQGLAYTELFTTWNWHIWSFRTSFGVYDYMKIYAPLIHYRYVGYALWPLVLALAGAVAWRGGGRGLAHLALFLLFSGLTVFQATYHSWINDFQAQGRYLFPIAGMAGLVLARFSSAIRPVLPLVLGLALILYGLGMYSFIAVGLAQIPK